MAKKPVATDSPDIDLYFDLGGDAVDAGRLCVQFKFRAMMNGGYLIAGKLKDANFNIIKRFLIEVEYLKKSRARVFRCQFRLKWGTGENRTLLQSAHIISLHATGGTADSADLEFIGIDPPSWYLNIGDGSGGVYKGRISEVLQKVVQDYAPNITLDVSETIDSPHNMFWMMGMDPKTFISSLLDWSSSLTRNKTQWIIANDDTFLQIKEQADVPSQNIGFYVGPTRGADGGSIRHWELVADNALSTTNTKVITNGMSAISGQYLDKESDPGEEKVIVKDKNTSKKYKAKTSATKAFTKPGDSAPPDVGFTQVNSVPEVYSGGELGVQYEKYIDGRARALWLNMTNMVMRCVFRVIGHGVYYSGIGLGTDTFTVQWLDIDGKPFFLSGNWIVYGFEHNYKPGDWTTDVYGARFDFDSAAKPVPEGDAGEGGG